MVTMKTVTPLPVETTGRRLLARMVLAVFLADHLKTRALTVVVAYACQFLSEAFGLKASTVLQMI
jgi:hypothetical protein